MAYIVPATFSQEQARQQGAEPIQMYVLNASQSGTDHKYYVNYNQDVYGYQLDANGNMISATQLYTGVPVSLGGMKTDTGGEVTDVQVSIPNTDRIAESFIQNQNYLRGKEIYIITTFAANLPIGPAANYLGSASDKNAVLKEKFIIDTATSDEVAVTFICKPKFMIKNVVVPNRFYSRECQWALKAKYAATECDPLASVNTASFPTCDGSLDNCKLRHNVKRFGGFPSIPTKGITVV